MIQSLVQAAKGCGQRKIPARSVKIRTTDYPGHVSCLIDESGEDELRLADATVY